MLRNRSTDGSTGCDRAAIPLLSVCVFANFQMCYCCIILYFYSVRVLQLSVARREDKEEDCLEPYIYAKRVPSLA